MDTRSDVEIRADLAYLFDKASQSLAARMAAALAEVELTPRGYCVLSKAMPAKLTQGEIAEIALLDKTTMVVTMDQLEEAGLARRSPCPWDRRARIVETTAKGADAVGKARSIIDGVFGDVLAVLAEHEREVFLDAMVKLVGAGGPLSGEARVEAGPRRRSSRTV